MTAMMRTTSFPTSIIAQLIYDGTISRRGVFTAEEVVPFEPLTAELKKRNITIEIIEDR
jgi:saccharopine dehydrogenase-like NADP-dependent oxidoreductase